MSDIEKIDLKSMDIAEEKREKLKELFPEVFTEKKVDFDKLKTVLGEIVETGRERYGMNWAGKSDCLRIIQQPSVGTLKPCRDESVDFDNTENLFIEGDNLEVLKLLQKSYYGKVKMIYIDPPYNTGNDFIYPDNYSESLDTYLKYTGQVDSEGRKYSTNAETDGRFHTRWLNMMYPRLYLARNLLREDGVIFISIDDNELTNLRKICDEIFGEENFIDNIIWKKRYGGGAKEKHLVTIHEYVLFYARSIDSIDPLFLPLEEISIEKYYKSKDEKFETRGPYRTHPLEAGKAMGERKNLIFPIPAPDGSEVLPKRQWLWSKERTMNALKNNELEFINGKEGWTVHTKQYLKGDDGLIRKGKAFSIYDAYYSQHGTNENIEIFGSAQIYSYPKPTGLIKFLMQLSTANGDLILDFFAGSATTAHAVFDLNLEDNNYRNFICIQLPELCNDDTAAFRAGYKNIAEIGKERIRRVIGKIQKESQPELKSVSEKSDLGFKVFRLHKSNFRVWDGESIAKDEQSIQEKLKLHINHIDPKSSTEDILYELFLKSGFELTTRIEKLNLTGKEVFSIAEGALLICLEKAITKEAIRAMAEKSPAMVICLDQGFKGNDQLKTNAVQIMKAKEVEFRTV